MSASQMSTGTIRSKCFEDTARPWNQQVGQLHSCHLYRGMEKLMAQPASGYSPEKGSFTPKLTLDRGRKRILYEKPNIHTWKIARQIIYFKNSKRNVMPWAPKGVFGASQNGSGMFLWPYVL